MQSCQLHILPIALNRQSAKLMSILQILSFYQRMGMALPEKPPLMMVESSALNEAEEQEGRSGGGHSHGPVFHTRGLTLTVEYRAIQQVVTRDGRRFTQPVDLSARDRYEVCLVFL